MNLNKSTIILIIGIVMIIYGAYKIATTKTATTVSTGGVTESTVESGNGLDGLILFAGIAIVGAKLFKLY